MRSFFVVLSIKPWPKIKYKNFNKKHKIFDNKAETNQIKVLVVL